MWVESLLLVPVGVTFSSFFPTGFEPRPSGPSSTCATPTRQLLLLQRSLIWLSLLLLLLLLQLRPLCLRPRSVAIFCPSSNAAQVSRWPWPTSCFLLFSFFRLLLSSLYFNERMASAATCQNVWSRFKLSNSETWLKFDPDNNKDILAWSTLTQELRG